MNRFQENKPKTAAPQATPPEAGSNQTIIKMSDSEKTSIISANQDMGQSLQEFANAELRLMDLKKEEKNLLEYKEKLATTVREKQANFNSIISMRLKMAGVTPDQNGKVDLNLEKSEIIVTHS